MQAKIGDRVVVRSHQVGAPDREGEVAEVLGREGEPPYRVRWSDGSESVFSPGADTLVRQSRKRRS